MLHERHHHTVLIKSNEIIQTFLKPHETGWLESWRVTYLNYAFDVGVVGVVDPASADELVDPVREVSAGSLVRVRSGQHHVLLRVQISVQLRKSLQHLHNYMGEENKTVSRVFS